MTTTERPLRLCAYLRVSSEAQVDGYGLQVQTEAVASWSAKHGHHIVQVFSDEGVSECAEDFVKEAVEYLDARGLIERHPDNANFVVVRDESEATA